MSGGHDDDNDGCDDDVVDDVYDDYVDGYDDNHDCRIQQSFSHNDSSFKKVDISTKFYWVVK